MSPESLSQALLLMPYVWQGGVFLAALYIFRKRSVFADPAARFKKLAWATGGFWVFYALSLTVFQYYSWLANSFSEILLRSPLDPAAPIPAPIKWFLDIFPENFGYFLFYSYGRFWLEIILAALFAYVFYLFLRMLRKYRERFFEEGEPELGWLLAFSAGWPNVTIFVFLSFVSVVLVSGYRLVLGQRYTTLGPVFLLASLLTLVSGFWLISAMGLGVLRL